MSPISTPCIEGRRVRGTQFVRVERVGYKHRRSTWWCRALRGIYLPMKPRDRTAGHALLAERHGRLERAWSCMHLTFTATIIVLFVGTTAYVASM